MICSPFLLEAVENDFVCLFVCLCETVCGSRERQPHADKAGQQLAVPSHLRSPAVHPLAIHGLLVSAFLPPHL